MQPKRIHLRISVSLLNQVDQAARNTDCTRSTYVRQAILLRLKGSATIKQEEEQYLEQLRKLYQRN